jgi:hypothetical protein
MKPDADMVMRKLAQNPSFCGLQKLNTLNLRLFHSPSNPRNHFSTVLIETNWYTTSCKYSGCSSLQSVYSKVEDVFDINYDTFANNTYSNAKLYVPIGKKADYEDTNWWSNFTNIEEYDYGTDAPVDQPKCQTPTISSQGGALTVQGIDDGTQVSVYSVNGTQVGTAVVQNGQATVSTTLQSGSIAIVKIGQKSVKVLLR